MLVNSAGSAFYVHTLGVDLVYPVHTLCIKNYAAAYGKGAALRAASGSPGRDRNFIVIRYFHYL